MGSWFGILVWDLGLGSRAWDLWLGIFALGNLAGRAGGTGWRTPGEPSGARLVNDVGLGSWFGILVWDRGLGSWFGILVWDLGLGISGLGSLSWGTWLGRPGEPAGGHRGNPPERDSCYCPVSN